MATSAQRRLQPQELRRFGTGSEHYVVPDLTTIQTASYSSFLQDTVVAEKPRDHGLESVLREIFPIVKMYTAYVPIYPSCYWSFAFCSRKYHPITDFDIDRYKRLKLKNNYYNIDMHIGSFALPEFVKKLIDAK